MDDLDRELTELCSSLEEVELLAIIQDAWLRLGATTLRSLYALREEQLPVLDRIRDMEWPVGADPEHVKLARDLVAAARRSLFAGIRILEMTEDALEEQEPQATVRTLKEMLPTAKHVLSLVEMAKLVVKKAHDPAVVLPILRASGEAGLVN